MPRDSAASDGQGRWTMGWLRRQDPGERPSSGPTQASSPFVPIGDARDVLQPAEPESERRQLIDLLVYAWDRARSPGVWERLAAGLAEVGVQVLRPDGERFDPGAHEVGGTEYTDDPAKVDTVAETEVAGFADRGVVFREPVVVVYRNDPGAG